MPVHVAKYISDDLFRIFLSQNACSKYLFFGDLHSQVSVIDLRIRFSRASPKTTKDFDFNLDDLQIRPKACWDCAEHPRPKELEAAFHD